MARPSGLQISAGALLMLTLQGCAGEELDRATSRSLPEQESQSLEYRSEDYGVALDHAAGWTVSETPTEAPLQAINVFPAGAVSPRQLPLTIHAPAELSYLGIYPSGWGTELPSGAHRAFTAIDDRPELGVPVNLNESLQFELADGEAWGWFLRFDELPASWSPDAYLFAQAAVPDLDTCCFDAVRGEPKPPAACDPMTGDRVERHGQVDTAARRELLGVLASIAFLEGPARDLVVHRPRAHQSIASPVTVEGVAPGPWFFEGSFPVELRTEEGELLARGAARSHSDWMTRGLVPFSLILEFTPPATPAGELVLRNDNPSGLPENALERTVPVRFARAQEP